MIYLAPSVLGADFKKLEYEIRTVSEAGPSTFIWM